MRWLKFAFKNILRNSRRSIVTVTLVAVGVAAILSAQGFSNNTNHLIMEFTVDRIGSLIVSHAEFFDRDEESTMEMGLSDYEGVKKILETDSRVDLVLPSMRFSGMISSDEKTGIFRALAVDAVEFHRDNSRTTFITGKALSLNPNMDGDPELVLGKDLAKSLNAEVGSSLTLMSSTTFGGLNAIDFVVVGTIDAGNIQANRYLAYMHIGDAQELVDTDQIHTMAIHLKDFDKTNSVYEELSDKFPNLGVTLWSSEAETYDRIKRLFGSIFGVMTLIVIIMVFFSISNTMTQTVVERTREIGTMAALGTPRKSIVMNFIIESFVIAIIGSVVGTALALLIGGSLAAGGAAIPPGPGFTAPIPLNFMITSRLIFNTAISLAVISAIASCFSARRGVKKSIVEALTHV